MIKDEVLEPQDYQERTKRKKHRTYLLISDVFVTTLVGLAAIGHWNVWIGLIAVAASTLAFHGLGKILRLNY